ncbi:hypothetical protein BCV70DRAFT_203191 [Testicularia cyperi]|uniref:Uncharacterized protein n=1 Tax=Testicularia cyperi TaxID=1882483 RepID=A0A317XFA9_9BASI|nr:hypothetical protein BCV70DRAFT_203191 [Testicularia cyperi]
MFASLRCARVLKRSICRLQRQCGCTLAIHSSARWKELSNLVASPSEVDDIWTHPLSAFLSSVAPIGLKLSDPTTVDKHRPPQEVFRTYTDIPWLGSTYRLHRFRSSKQLIKGLTADVLISVASIAYGTAPKYQVNADDQKPWQDMVELVVSRYIGAGGRPQQRWGDGESGDAQGSSEAFETFVGVDVDMPLQNGAGQKNDASQSALAN